MDEYPSVLLALFATSQIEIRTITDELERGQITLDEWHREMEKIIIRYALAAMMLGVDSEQLTEQAEQAVNLHVAGQMPYLNNFANDIRTGLSGGWNGQWNVRAEMYGEAVQPLYWKGITRFLVLPAYPGDGSSECLMSDRCMWYLDWLDEANLDVDAYWVNLRDDRVCPTCTVRGDDWFPLRVRDGIVPK